ncbi:hypothetical protein [Gemmatimonas sp.]|uniref:hypothetical protein n=2 Tax=Gemmatimonas sp. TaxID=1962908 RepID=UPI00391EFBD3
MKRTSTSGLRRWTHVRAVLWFEVRAQQREPLTTLYALVFFLLALGYASSSAVELVGNRGAVPRTAPWALLLAFGGLTAFGQVITTMIATTAMLRDEAQRTRALVATSGLDPRTWFLARLAAALVVMLAVYAAMPLGVVVGTALAGGAVGAAAQGGARAYLLITVPTVFTVTILLASAALITRRVLGVLAAALALVGLWQLALALAAQPAVATVGALLDPFGNAPVLVATRAWSEAARTADVVPWRGVIAANRLLWSALSLALLLLVLRRYAALAFPEPVRAESPMRDAHATRTLSRASSAVASLRRFTASWMVHDGGWRIVRVLAVLNATANAAARPITRTAGEPPFVAVLLLVSEHARLFLILLATVYAGELVWRDRDVRVHEVVAALPVSRTALLLGRVQGLLLAQGRIVLPLAVSALLVAAFRGDASTTHGAAWLAQWVAWSLFVLWLPFAQLTLLSLAVHLLLDHKVAAHLLLITGWVLAVVLDGQGVSAWWVRFAEPPPLLIDGVVAWAPLLQRGAYWTAVSAVLLLVCRRFSRQGAAGR